uniref:Uncharacterized protein n=1 Tax=Ditylenchus dipsaci TaxID=166011 RepID=A0A915DJ45_9BILA
MSSMFAPNGRKFQTILYTGIAAVLSRFYPAYAMSYTNTAADRFNIFIKNSYISRGTPISENSAIWLWSLTLNCFFIGSFLGNLLTPLFTDRFGRKTATVVGVYGIRIFGSMMFSINDGGWQLIIAEALYCYNVPGMIFGTDYFFGQNLFMLVGKPLALFQHFCKRPEQAQKALQFYQGDRTDFKSFLEETLKEEDASCKTSVKYILKDLLSERHLRKAILLGIAALQLSAGVWPITTELLLAHFPGTKAQICSSVLFGFNFVAGICGVYTVGNISRRKLVLVTSTIHIISLAAYLWCLLAMAVYNVTSGIGFGTIVYFLSSELLPQFHRAMGAYKSYNVQSFIPLFVVPNALCTIYLYCELPETSGREIYEIVDELKISSKGTKMQKESYSVTSKQKDIELKNMLEK